MKFEYFVGFNDNINTVTTTNSFFFKYKGYITHEKHQPCSQCYLSITNGNPCLIGETIQMCACVCVCRTDKGKWMSEAVGVY